MLYRLRLINLKCSTEIDAFVLLVTKHVFHPNCADMLLVLCLPCLSLSLLTFLLLILSKPLLNSYSPTSLACLVKIFQKGLHYLRLRTIYPYVFTTIDLIQNITEQCQ